MKKCFISILLFISTVCHSADCGRIVPFILHWEGGYAKLPNDPGGETNKGVTWATWMKFYGRTYNEFLKMPADKWAHIYKVGYWDAMRCDEIKSQKIAEVLAEWCWLSGAKIPTKNVQRLLALKADAMLGDETLRAINRANEQQLYESLIGTRYKFIAKIPYYSPSNWAYVDGWLNRMTGLVFYQTSLK